MAQQQAKPVIPSAFTAPIKREPNLGVHLVRVYHSYSDAQAFALKLSRTRKDMIRVLRYGRPDSELQPAMSCKPINVQSIPLDRLTAILDYFVSRSAITRGERRTILATHRKAHREALKAKHTGSTCRAEGSRRWANIGRGVITAEYRRANGVW